jgi:hypothetical protein
VGTQLDEPAVDKSHCDYVWRAQILVSRDAILAWHASYDRSHHGDSSYPLKTYSPWLLGDGT